MEAKHILVLKENASLRLQVTKLEEQITVLKRKKNSRNSSTPPSQDPNRLKRNTSLRNKGEKPNGGQPGHKGKTLEFTSTPDEVVELKPDICENCGDIVWFILINLKNM